MSNTIRYDSLLVRELARELRERLLGRRVSAIRFERERGVVAIRCGRHALVWALAPNRTGLQWLENESRWSGNVGVPQSAIISDVVAPADDRVVTFSIEAEERESTHELDSAGALIIELVGSAANAIAVARGTRITAVLRPRTDGTRPLAAGGRYSPVAPSHRLGSSADLLPQQWHHLLGDVHPSERARTLLANVAYTSPINGAHILGDAAFASDEQLLDEAYERWLALVEPVSRTPCVLQAEREAQPYPFALTGCRCLPQLSLIAAFQTLAADLTDPAQPDLDAACERLRRQHDRIEMRVARLRTQLDGAAAEADELRRAADLLLSQMQRVTKGAQHVELDDFSGGTIRIDLDPALAAADNARRLYDHARKRQRAAEKLPALIERAERERDRLRDLIKRAEQGDATLEELGPVESTRRGPKRAQNVERRPYRRYRTSSGLEVRVGRGPASNDELTLRHSHPDDIWLHARDVGGAHVVLRWTDRVANPPATDLAEAAVLAALHSRARTSGTVPVDWTRRKYVRKPRKAKPGSVLVERAKTLFVQPDAELERRLRVEIDGETPAD